jgi:hypothetical protein
MSRRNSAFPLGLYTPMLLGTGITKTHRINNYKIVNDQFQRAVNKIHYEHTNFLAHCAKYVFNNFPVNESYTRNLDSGRDVLFPNSYTPFFGAKSFVNMYGVPSKALDSTAQFFEYYSDVTLQAEPWPLIDIHHPYKRVACNAQLFMKYEPRAGEGVQITTRFSGSIDFYYYYDSPSLTIETAWTATPVKFNIFKFFDVLFYDAFTIIWQFSARKRVTDKILDETTYSYLSGTTEEHFNNPEFASYDDLYALPFLHFSVLKKTKADYEKIDRRTQQFLMNYARGNPQKVRPQEKISFYFDPEKIADALEMAYASEKIFFPTTNIVSNVGDIPVYPPEQYNQMEHSYHGLPASVSLFFPPSDDFIKKINLYENLRDEQKIFPRTTNLLINALAVDGDTVEQERDFRTKKNSFLQIEILEIKNNPYAFYLIVRQNLFDAYKWFLKFKDKLDLGEVNYDEWIPYREIIFKTFKTGERFIFQNDFFDAVELTPMLHWNVGILNIVNKPDWIKTTHQ